MELTVQNIDLAMDFAQVAEERGRDGRAMPLDVMEVISKQKGIHFSFQKRSLMAYNRPEGGKRERLFVKPKRERLFVLASARRMLSRLRVVAFRWRLGVAH